MSDDVISLDHLLNRVAGHVSVRGIKYPVTAVNAIDFQIIERALSGDDSLKMPEALALAQKLCPTLPDDVWASGDTVIVGIIFGQSRKAIEKVESTLPLSSGPTTSQPSAETNASPAG